MTTRTSLLILFVLAPIALLRAGGGQGPPEGAVQRHYQSAQDALASGDLQKAETDYRKALTATLRLVAHRRAAEKRDEDSIRLLRAAVRVEDDADTRIDLAAVYLQRRDLDNARAEILSVLSVFPDHARAHDIAGRIALAAGQHEEAMRELELSVQALPNFNSAYTLGLTYLKLRKLDDARTLFATIQKALNETADLHVLFGRAYRAHEYFDEAIAEFVRAIELDEKRPQTHAQLGLTYVLQGDQQRLVDAQSAFQRELAINASDVQSQFFLGVIHLLSRSHRDAEPLLVAATLARPDNPDPWLYLGQLYMETDRFANAIDPLRRSIQLTTDVARNGYQVSRAHFQLGQALLRLGKRDEAQQELGRAAQLRGDALRADQQRATEYLGASPASATRIVATQLAREDANDVEAATTASDGARDTPSATIEPALDGLIAEAYFNLGVIQARKERFEEAADLFDAAEEWNRTLAGLDRAAGLASFRAGRYGAAIERLGAHLARHGEDWTARRALGLSYFMQADYTRSADALGLLLTEPRDDPAALYALGAALVTSGRSRQVLAQFPALQTRFPAIAEIRLALGQAYAEENQHTQALVEFDAALAINPKLDRANYFAGLLLLRQGRLDEAAFRFRAELAVTPSDPQSRYHLAYVLVMGDRADEAIPLMKAVVRDKPDYAEARYQLGKVLAERGDLDEAIAHLERSVALDDRQEHAWYQLSLAYQRGGRAADAARARERYQSLKAASR